MITMQEYINNINISKATTALKKDVEVNNVVQNEIIKEDETFIEVLKTIQKLAHLENDDPKDRETILKPVRRLLNHQSESVRKTAQETLDKLTN